MAKAKKPDPKSEALSQDGVLNPTPEAVRDDLFTGNPFFDAKDQVQVRYEMVRRHQVDGIAISDAAETFGVTRPTFYKAQNALQTTGLAGLLPSRRGPRGGHKISTEVVAFVADLKTASPALTTSQCVGAIETRFGIKVHRRSLERARARKKKRINPPRSARRRTPRSATRRCAPRYCAAGARLVPVSAFSTAEVWRNGFEHSGRSPLSRWPAPIIGSRPQPRTTQHRQQATSLVLSPASSSPSQWSPSMPELKATADHLKRDAYLYVRQSTLRQVAEHGESTKRQYALRDRAVAAGWPIERIHVIDCDLGKSGSNAAARDGFQQLVSEVALGKAGVVMGLEVSRLARNSADWHRLIELCALTATLIVDEDGIYDPAAFNDRLLLGLKGTMSEAELHILKARMRGGQLNKAKRGELEMRPPVGLVYMAEGTLGLDPDMQVQRAIRLVFETFDRTGSAVQTVRFFREQGLMFPRRLLTGSNKGELLWAPPRHSRILQVLHNPRYAGAFAYGRTRTRHRPDGGTSVVKVARADWQFVIPGTHQGYIDWDCFETNQRRLADKARAFGGEGLSGPARGGPALLQGRVLCGLCGERMSVRYSQEHGRIVPTYLCQANATRRAGWTCQSVPGKLVDAAVAALMIELMTPMTLAVTLEVQRELEARAAETDAARRQHVERMQYEAELARRRYMKVDPDNRLVADTLEADWNGKLRLHAEAVEEYERRSKHQAATLSAEARRRILGQIGRAQ